MTSSTAKLDLVQSFLWWSWLQSKPPPRSHSSSGRECRNVSRINRLQQLRLYTGQELLHNPGLGESVMIMMAQSGEDLLHLFKLRSLPWSNHVRISLICPYRMSTLVHAWWCRGRTRSSTRSPVCSLHRDSPLENVPWRIRSHKTYKIAFVPLAAPLWGETTRHWGQMN